MRYYRKIGLNKHNMLSIFMLSCSGFLMDKSYIITIYNDPNLQISSDDNVLRLRAADDNYVGYKNEITAKLTLNSQKIKIKYEGKPLCTFPDINEVAACSKFDESNNDSVWDIVTTENGKQLQQGDRCLTKSEYDEFYKGYLLRMQVCTNDEKQMWHFEEIEFTDEEMSDAENRSSLNKRRIKYLLDHGKDKPLKPADIHDIPPEE